MQAGAPLAARLLEALPGRRGDSGGEPDELEQALGSLIGEARAAWPEVELTDGVFIDHLAARLLPALPLREALGEIRASDLYLACGCASGDSAALRAFEEGFLGEVGPAVVHLRGGATFADEVKQMLRERLLVREADRAPRIAEYAGRGSLRAWLRVVAVRIAISALRKGRLEVPADEEPLLELPTPADDPELDHLKRLYRAEFREAFLAALALLTDKQRNLLRHQVLHGLSVTEIGALHRVHQATAARWLVKARERLFSETRKQLTRRLRVEREELDSILRLIQSRLDVSLRDYLG